MEYYYIGVEGSIACTRICAIKRTKESNETDEGYRNWHVAAGTDLQMIPIDKNAEFIADGIQKLMQKVTKIDNWKSGAIIRKIVVVFPQEQDHKMLEFERFFTEKFINDQGISKKFAVLPEIDLVMKTHFELYDDGIALQSGTDTFCKKKVKNSKEIMFLDTIPEASEAGGAYWLARTALQMVIQEIETVQGPKKLDFIREIFQKEIFPDMEVFEMNELLFTAKMRHRLARVTEVLAARPFEMENACMKRYREQAWKIMRAMKERALAEQADAAAKGEQQDQNDQRPNITPSLQIDEGDLNFFMDFKDEIVQRMAESDEARAIIEARFAEDDLITSLFEKAGEHLGNLITRTLSAQPRIRDGPPSKHHRDDSDASTSGAETGSDGDSVRSRSPPEAATPKATRTPVPTTPVHHPSSPAMPTTPTPLSVQIQSQLSAPMPPTPFKDLKPATQDHGADTLKVVMFGRMFDSYGFLESGLLDGISNSSYNNVALYRKREVSAAAAAVKAAHDDGCFIELTPAELLDVTSFGKDRKDFKAMSTKEKTEMVKKRAR
ncbi:hypothetical protein L5515_013259 [Caenorhabditis briggsae]|nr:hypothetical protein L3Y34_017116 [Caenorhabditis briggsae]ULU04097.1 hypothetical protein L3Y34_017116 [Caenorhabditis briggsae]UMM16100.1 hypothetical protein L5515_013259 [Caenorhabditis briggsae]